jgi:hypothetical protein
MIAPIPLTSTILRNQFYDYARPNDKISYMLKKQELISLSKGFYVAKEAVSNNIYLKHQAANIIYGPSYISCYSALSFYGLLAEATTRIESITMKRSKTLKNELGIFEYKTIASPSTFCLGIHSKKLNPTATILIASPEKAICDLIWTTPKLTLKSLDDLVYFLEEDIRMEIGILALANKKDVINCIEFGKKKKEIQFLLNLINKLS